MNALEPCSALLESGVHGIIETMDVHLSPELERQLTEAAYFDRPECRETSGRCDRKLPGGIVPGPHVAGQPVRRPEEWEGKARR